MKQEEIEKVAKKHAQEQLILLNQAQRKLHEFSEIEIIDDFKAGFDFANKHWQEKTRWKSLLTEPPTEFSEKKQIFIKHKNSEISVYLLYSDRSAEHAVEMGFIEWKEID